MLNPWWNKVELGLTDEEADKMSAGLGAYLDEHGLDEESWEQAKVSSDVSFTQWLASLTLDHDRCDVLGPEHQVWGMFPAQMQQDAVLLREELGERVDDAVPA